LAESFEDFKRDIPRRSEFVLKHIEKTLATAVIIMSRIALAARRCCPLGRGVGHVLRRPDGQPEKLAGVCMDITERKHAEETLRQRTRR
jgi:PAS domain-containing protein